MMINSMTIFNSFLTPPFYDSSSMEVSFFYFFVMSRQRLSDC